MTKNGGKQGAIPMTGIDHSLVYNARKFITGANAHSVRTWIFCYENLPAGRRDLYKNSYANLSLATICCWLCGCRWRLLGAAFPSDGRKAITSTFNQNRTVAHIEEQRLQLPRRRQPREPFALSLLDSFRSHVPVRICAKAAVLATNIAPAFLSPLNVHLSQFEATLANSPPPG